MPQSVPVLIGVLLCLLVVFGCQTPLTVKQIQANNPMAKNAPKTPAKIVDVWNSYAQKTSDGTVMRGMAGRVHFYDNHRSDQAVKVDGDVTVYVFDGNETDPTHTKPIKIFQFKAESLAQHHTHQKTFGHGYDFFLPIDEINGLEQPLSIIVRFDNQLDGKFIMSSQPVSTVLAGRKPEVPMEPGVREFLDSQSLLAETNRSLPTANDASAIRQVSYLSETPEVEPTKSQSRVATTIPLSSDMTRRLYAVPSYDTPEN